MYVFVAVYQQGRLVGVTGRVGSGKSSLLAAITAEMTRLHGQVQYTIYTRGGMNIV